MLEFLLEYDPAGEPTTGPMWPRRPNDKTATTPGVSGAPSSPNTPARFPPPSGYSLRVNHKSLSTDHSPDRNSQFL